MVLDAHNRAFQFFSGVPARLIYDNLKTVVDAVYAGKTRKFNRRFLTLANHYLFEPVACTPASGWEKGQVENQVGNIREWLFTPLARFASFADLNGWLTHRCTELTERKHPTQRHRTIAQCSADEQALLRPVTASFDGYVEQMMRVSSTCLSCALTAIVTTCLLGSQVKRSLFVLPQIRYVSWPTLKWWPRTHAVLSVSNLFVILGIICLY